MNNEQRYYDALKRITKYQTPEKLLRRAEKQYGCSGEEALEMAYENIQQEARNAIAGKRRPKDSDSSIKLSRLEEKEAAESLARDAMGEIEG